MVIVIPRSRAMDPHMEGAMDPHLEGAMDPHMAGAMAEDAAEVLEGALGPVWAGAAVMAEVSDKADFLQGADGMDRPMVVPMPWTPKKRWVCSGKTPRQSKVIWMPYSGE